MTYLCRLTTHIFQYSSVNRVNICGSPSIFVSTTLQSNRRHRYQLSHFEYKLSSTVNSWKTFSKSAIFSTGHIGNKLAFDFMKRAYAVNWMRCLAAFLRLKSILFAMLLFRSFHQIDKIDQLANFFLEVCRSTKVHEIRMVCTFNEMTNTIKAKLFLNISFNSQFLVFPHYQSFTSFLMSKFHPPLDI